MAASGITARKRKASTAAAVPADEVAKVKKAKKSPKSTEAAKSKKAAKVVEKDVIEDPVEEAQEEAEAEEEEEEDDQTEALLKGFESDSDDDENAKEGGLEPGQEVPNALEKLSKKQKKAIKKAAEEAANDLPGVVYIGRIPHGFYEAEMKAYFSQFGNILKIRLSRNRRTGKSKHYAWIQFESRGVAEIVAKTMDNYLLFNHILKVKLVPDEQLPENLFKGANRRFKIVPWNKIEGRRLEQGVGEEQWEKRITKAEKKREIAAEKLKQIGYEFEAPKIKSAKGVSKKPVPQVESGEEELAGGEDVVMATEAAPEVEEPVKAKKEKKEKKEKKVKKSKVVEDDLAGDENVIMATEAAPAVEEPVKAKKEKKVQKSKVVEETPAKATKAKKSKKSKA
ncbi:hypothetical protein DSL72_001114 [Monilinia vaccinii-corymbosi]|uniref:RRM domain-containing protein n=1 Tax=Monilinia vaccinii-corymbosi TaxID=61207 RepID=A0A8A3PAI3_9HELO|nr:hypothetical protein DSL72_001114 [Monilinia vaccinii-corymbosi]